MIDRPRNALTSGTPVKEENMEYYELPVGFGMALAMNPPAWNAYSAMTAEQKQAILNKVRDVKSKEQMHRIVNSLISQ